MSPGLPSVLEVKELQGDFMADLCNNQMATSESWKSREYDTDGQAHIDPKSMPRMLSAVHFTLRTWLTVNETERRNCLKIYIIFKMHGGSLYSLVGL